VRGPRTRPRPQATAPCGEAWQVARRHDGTRRQQRLNAPYPILSVSQAAARLPTADAEARDWLRQNGLVHDAGSKNWVSWREVLDFVEGCPRIGEVGGQKHQERGARGKNVKKSVLQRTRLIPLESPQRKLEKK